MWRIDGPKFQRGGPLVVPRQAAPLGVRLPYRRADGEGPGGPSPLFASVAANGWALDVRHDPGGAPATGPSPVRFGDLLLELATAQALSDALRTAWGRAPELVYRGPRHRLMERCDLPFAACEADDGHSVTTASDPGDSPVHVEVRPNLWPRWAAEPPPANDRPAHVPPWLDLLDDKRVQVHSALPMRYYLAVERSLGVRLPLDGAPAPRFRTDATAQPRHVVLVATTSAPGSGQDYGADRLLAVARGLRHAGDSGRRCTLLTNDDRPGGPRPDRDLVDTVIGADDVDCLDLFGSAELVVGNDTGLTHLAALTRRPDGTGPHVLALHGRYSHLKWVTGSPRHHSVATPASQMLALADSGLYTTPYGLPIDDSLWGTSDIRDISPDAIARFAQSCLDGTG
ncbi:glycosyltransferase family 9 protein [Streptomyces varsoviensis]|uniref:Glycosyl transferase n=1 Tax=Streptomyces varsoviensis TaxID=67373 RepID=A0ABR5JEC9_9ACTN|nr:hypothetical protein [Streptomyces varsoviensis]KOG91760.1 hypothetical protein ADK38_01395 [Streptomyces varsoviensis]